MKHLQFLAISVIFLVVNGLIIENTCFAQGNWKTDQITIALIPEKNKSDQLRRYRHISSYLAENLDIHIRLDLVPYDRLTETLKTGKAQAGFFGSFGYVITDYQIGLIPLARPVWKNGTSTYAGYLIARKNGGIKNIEDMKNKKIALVSKTTTAGYIFPKAYLLKNGVPSLESHFSKVVYTGNHENAAWTVFYGEADLAALKNHIYNELIKTYPKFAETIEVIAESEKVPSNCFAVSSNMEPDLKDKMLALLLKMHQNKKGQKKLSQFGAKKFIVTTGANYKSCYEMIKNAKIDLSEL